MSHIYCPTSAKSMKNFTFYGIPPNYKQCPIKSYVRDTENGHGKFLNVWGFNG
jgi:hypothetical protein